MTETMHWHPLRESLITAFNGETPSAELEQEIIEVFQVQPSLVAAKAERVVEKYASGKIRSGWAILRHEVADAAHAPADVSVKVDAKEQQLELVKVWMRTAGMHIDRESELLAELFGDRGRLREWGAYDYVNDEFIGDEQLKAYVVSLWQKARPVAEQLDRDAVARAEAWKASKVLLAEKERELREQRQAEAEAATEAKRARAAEQAEVQA